ncbi:MAG TPA: hypothetical protein VGS19_15195 [Streptosporangiaceae bacterium]|nr:hypothetical protein [Streptosporangiaceae bacterium]
MRHPHSSRMGLAFLEALVSVAVLVLVTVGVARLAVSAGGRAGTGAPVVLAGPGSATGPAFSYGFDFAAQGPYSGPGADAQAVASARHVMSSVPAMAEDTSIKDWGLPDPEPTPGRFNLAALAARVNLITATGGVPVVTLCAAPEWMTGSTSPDVAPTPAHYHDFAALAAHVARSFPQVRYFVVWNELKGFWNTAANTWDYQHYTQMYNDVYTAIKRVRPDALVGGPYAPTPPYARPQPGDLPSTPHGDWGYLDQRVLTAISYWLVNKAGADFLAVDGPDFPVSGPITDPLTATQKYAAVDQWLRRRTPLPIWWMETHIQPPASGWPAGRAAAIRVAALIQAAGSGAVAALQWQPEQGDGIPDEGLWTSTQYPGGGQPTVLAQLLPAASRVFRYQVGLIPGQPSGVIAGAGRGGAIAANTTSHPVTARLGGDRTVQLGPGQVWITVSAASR